MDFTAADRFLNREISWLAFNMRVLEEANNARHPLLERLRFLAISHRNLEEFTNVRVAGLKAQQKAAFQTISRDGRTPAAQLRLIAEEIQMLIHKQQETWLELREALAVEDIHIVDAASLTKQQKNALAVVFMESIFPLLTPLAVDPAHPFPFIHNKGLALVLELSSVETGHVMRALVPLPRMLPRLIRLSSEEHSYIPLEDVILLFFEQVFPGYTLVGDGVFQVLRDSELEIDEEAEDLMRFFETALKRRRRGHLIQMMLNRTMQPSIRDFLKEHTLLQEEDIIVVDGLVDLSDIEQLCDIERPDLKFIPYVPRFPERIKDYNGDCFASIHAKDILVHHPFESFDVVVLFLRQAARDPDVVVIKQTLYRTSKDSPIVEALIAAAENGKQVTAIVELRARFDEEANIQWARDMERAGVQVVFGFMELKTHCKLSLVVRREHDALKTYVHFGTGNYHSVTAKVYTDLSYFTCDPALSRDAVKIFNFLTGYAKPKSMEKASIAPFSLRSTLLERIDQEIAYAQKGHPASIWAKMNALVDPELIDKLYEASNAGVSIDLIVRGICCLRPGVEGLSSNIRVKSIVGRFLEHARIYCFGAGSPMPSPHARVYISSADWMPRNCDWRVEVLIPICNATVHRQIIEQIMLTNLHDTAQSWALGPDGHYKRMPHEGETFFSAHQYFMDHPSISGRGSMVKNDPPLLSGGNQSDRE